MHESIHCPLSFDIQCLLALEIAVSFKELQYEVSEKAGLQDRLVEIVKEHGQQTEKFLEVLVQLSPPSGDGAAEIG